MKMLRTVQFRVDTDGDEVRGIDANYASHSTNIASDVDAETTGVFSTQRMYVQQWMPWIFGEETNPFVANPSPFDGKFTIHPFEADTKDKPSHE